MFNKQKNINLLMQERNELENEIQRLKIENETLRKLIDERIKKIENEIRLLKIKKGGD